VQRAELNAAMPIGAVIAYGGSVAPEGWHLCDGSAHGSTELQAIIGSATTPDLRDRFVVGAGAGYANGATGGAAAVTLGIEHVPWHNHTGSTSQVDVNHTHSGRTGHQADGYNAAHGHGTGLRTGTGGPPEAGGWDGNVLKRHTDAPPGGYWNDLNAGVVNTDHQHDFSTGWMSQSNVHSHSITAEGGGQAHENRPPYYALTYIMKKI
jgi:microcystin-dependent protein